MDCDAQLAKIGTGMSGRSRETVRDVVGILGENSEENISGGNCPLGVMSGEYPDFHAGLQVSRLPRRQHASADRQLSTSYTISSANWSINRLRLVRVTVNCTVQYHVMWPAL